MAKKCVDSVTLADYHRASDPADAGKPLFMGRSVCSLLLNGLVDVTEGAMEGYAHIASKIKTVCFSCRLPKPVDFQHFWL